MEYIDTDLLFTKENSLSTRSRSFGQNSPPDKQDDLTEILGIKVRLGNQPLVYNLNDLSGRTFKDTGLEQIAGKENYLIVHAISAIRTTGKAKVEELQYFAVSEDPLNLQTVDLIPETKYNQILGLNLNLTGALNLSGEASLEIPGVVTDNLVSEFIDIGTNMQLQLSSALGFVGTFKYNIKIPVIQSIGIGSNTCSWILKPNEDKTPLLGDQLLIQSVSVPSGCKQIRYKISGLVKADKGIFWKQQQKSTNAFTIQVNLK